MSARDERYGIKGADIKEGDWVSMTKDGVELSGTVSRIEGTSALICHEWGTCWAKVWELNRVTPN